MIAGFMRVIFKKQPRTRTHSEGIQLEFRISQVFCTFPACCYRIWLWEVCVHWFSQIVPCTSQCPTLKFLLVLLQEISCYLYQVNIQIKLSSEQKQCLVIYNTRILEIDGNVHSGSYFILSINEPYIQFSDKSISWTVQIFSVTPRV
jgi:hypothetical protein